MREEVQLACVRPTDEHKERAGDEPLPRVLSTNDAAPHINRKPQTMRRWACFENGPIRPIRINGRLAWRVSDLEALLNGKAAK